MVFFKAPIIFQNLKQFVNPPYLGLGHEMAFSVKMGCFFVILSLCKEQCRACVLLKRGVNQGCIFEVGVTNWGSYLKIYPIIILDWTRSYCLIIKIHDVNTCRTYHILFSKTSFNMICSVLIGSKQVAMYIYKIKNPVFIVNWIIRVIILGQVRKSPSL